MKLIIKNILGITIVALSITSLNARYSTTDVIDDEEFTTSPLTSPSVIERQSVGRRRHGYGSRKKMQQQYIDNDEKFGAELVDSASDSPQGTQYGESN